jgi:hypothetical protein
MFYVLTDGSDILVRYPYTLADLKRDNLSTSFPQVISDEIAADFNCFPVTPTDPPAYDYTVNLERTAVLQSTEWVEQWISTPATPEEIQERTDNEANEVRQERDRLLEESDWTQLPDTPVDPAAWTTYRQDLRNVPQQAGFPWNVTWPIPPLT